MRRDSIRVAWWPSTVLLSKRHDIPPFDLCFLLLFGDVRYLLPALSDRIPQTLKTSSIAVIPSKHGSQNTQMHLQGFPVLVLSKIASHLPSREIVFLAQQSEVFRYAFKPQLQRRHREVHLSSLEDCCYAFQILLWPLRCHPLGRYVRNIEMNTSYVYWRLLQYTPSHQHAPPIQRRYCALEGRRTSGGIQGR